MTMTVYRLDPVAGTEGRPEWQASKWKGTCWVEGASEEAARMKVEMATQEMANMEYNKPTRYPPWRNRQLINCVPDRSKQVAKGRILLANGKTLKIRQF